MLRSVAVALDDGPGSLEARRIAVATAKRLGASVVGLALLDLPDLAPIEPSRAGASAFKAHRDQVVVEEARGKLAALAASLREEAAAAGVAVEILDTEGSVQEGMLEAAQVADLLVVGADCDFLFTEEAELAEGLRELLHDTPRPLLLCPAIPGPVGPVVVTLDGSAAGLRALFLFALLGLGQGSEVAVVAFDEDLEVARRRAEQGAKLLGRHDVPARIEAVGLDGERIEVALLREVRRHSPGLLVMGSLAPRGLWGRLFGDRTGELLEAAGCPVFVSS